MPSPLSGAEWSIVSAYRHSPAHRRFVYAAPSIWSRRTIDAMFITAPCGESPTEIQGLSLRTRTPLLGILAAMEDLLHLVRLLREALSSLHDATSEGDRDCITRQLIADLRAHLEHAHVSA